MSMRAPVIGVLCCNEVAARPVQAVASRFIEPLARIAGATVLLVPAMGEAVDAAAVAGILDGLLLTGSRSNVAPHRYGGSGQGTQTLDEQRDGVALALAERMIEAGKPVFGICRGLQEINVLFGGSLSADACRDRHHPGSWDGEYEALFDHRHEVRLSDGGRLQLATGARTLTVNSVHEQGIARLGGGLSIEAMACEDGLIEAISARPCGAEVLGVQWHPEWDVHASAGSQAFFALVGGALRSAARERPAPVPARSHRFRGYPAGPLRGH